MFQVSVKLIISGEGFHPTPELMATRHLHRAWKTGDLVIPRATKRFSDSGVAYRILHEYANADWTVVALESLREVAAQVEGIQSAAEIPTPHLSVFVETDGGDYPPIFLSREFLDVVDSIGCEIDIDVIKDL
jgi:hypothetical protein